MKILYEFAFPEDGESFSYQVDIDDESLLVVQGDKLEKLPEWTRLDHKKCSNCPLKSTDCEYCPVAVNLWKVVERTKDMFSYKTCVTYVHTKERTFFKKADLQVGLFSLMGVLMGGSSCPHFQFLKPMLTFHLPFASVDETLLRSASFHLFKKWLDHKKDPSVKIDFTELKHNYSQLEFVNMGTLERLRSIPQKDGNKNALVLLNVFAQFFSMELNSDFSSLAKYFGIEEENSELLKLES
jgi:hypothetical protein